MPYPDTFPVGLRILVVDDDPLCLLILERMLRQCSYTVTTCSRAATALSLLRENRDKFDLVISDVYMPDMDGFKLLELIGLEMDLPVIMMSANGETSAVMKGITHGACDYLLKPVRIEELRNIWQHVFRKKSREACTEDQSGDWDDNDRLQGGQECSSKKRKDKTEPFSDGHGHGHLEEESSLKKARVVWSIELHQQFVDAVNKLGIDKAVPKKILEIMNVQGLTRENVASHLQKYRLYLKRLSGVDPAPYPVASFQAASEGSTLGGTMRITPGGRGAGVTRQGQMNAGSGPGGGGLGDSCKLSLGSIDAGTLATLAQLQALQQKQSAFSSLGGLRGSAGAVGGGADLLAGDLNLLMQAQQEAAVRQRMADAGRAEIVGAGEVHGGGAGAGGGMGLRGRSLGQEGLGQEAGASLGAGPGMPLGSRVEQGRGNAMNEGDLSSFADRRHRGDNFLGAAQAGDTNDLSLSILLNQFMNPQQGGRILRPKFESHFSP